MKANFDRLLGATVLACSAAACLVAGCGGGGGDGATAPVAAAPASTPQLATIVLPANAVAIAASPRVVSWQIDAARIAAATIGPGGGSIVATAADGSRFTLAVPPGALADDVAISVTPISAFSGGRWNRIVGVQLLPDGQQFLRSATLQIEPGAAIPIERQVALGFSGETSGEQFIAYIDAASLTPRILLDHFSARALADMSPQDLVDAQLANPSSALARIENELGAGLALERQRQLLGLPNDGAVDLGDLIGRYLQAYWDTVLKVKIGAAVAGDSCDGWKSVIADTLSLSRQSQLAGLGDGNDLLGRGGDVAGIAGSGDYVRATVPFAGNILDSASYACARKASNDCVVGHDLGIVRTVLSIDRQRQLLGAASDDFDTSYLREEERIDACLGFRTELGSTMTVSGLAGAAKATTTVSATALQGTAALQPVAPEVALSNTRLQVDPPGCGSVSDVTTGDGRLSATFSFDPSAPGGRPQSATLALVVGGTGESWTLSGCDLGAGRYGPQQLWSDALSVVDADALNGGTYSFSASRFSPGGWDLPPSGAVLMQRTFKRTVGNIDENTTLKVTHTPQPLVENPIPTP